MSLCVIYDYSYEVPWLLSILKHCIGIHACNFIKRNLEALLINVLSLKNLKNNQIVQDSKTAMTWFVFWLSSAKFTRALSIFLARHQLSLIVKMQIVLLCRIPSILNNCQPWNRFHSSTAARWQIKCFLSRSVCIWWLVLLSLLGPGSVLDHRC